MADVFMTLLTISRHPIPLSLASQQPGEAYNETLVTDFPPVKLYSNRCRAPSVALVLPKRAPFQSLPFMTRFVTGVQESTSCGLRLPPSW